jgi:hypothetical protein
MEQALMTNIYSMLVIVLTEGRSHYNANTGPIHRQSQAPLL